MYRNKKWHEVPLDVSKKLMRLNSQARRENDWGPMYGTMMDVPDVTLEGKRLRYEVRFANPGFIHHARLAMVEEGQSLVWFEVRNQLIKPARRTVAV